MQRAVCDRYVPTISLPVTSVQVCADIGATALLDSLPDVEWPLGDRGHHGDRFRDSSKNKAHRTRLQSRQVSCFSSKSGQAPLHDGVRRRGIPIFLANCGATTLRLRLESLAHPSRHRALSPRGRVFAGSGGLRLPAIFGIVDPYPVQDRRKTSGHDIEGPGRTTTSGQGHAPDLQRQAFGDDACGLDQRRPDTGFVTFQDTPPSVPLTRLV